MNFGDLNPVLGRIITLLKEIARYTNPAACSCVATTSAGAGNVAAGFKDVTFVQVSGSPIITFPDASTYTLAAGEHLRIVAPAQTKLGAFTIAGGTHQWVGVK